jgi:hypothetical protein
MAIEAKRDLRVILPYSLCIAGLFAALFMKEITWTQFLAGMALLNVPAFFGLKSEGVPVVNMSEPPGPPDTPVTIIIPPSEAVPPPKENRP